MTIDILTHKKSGPWTQLTYKSNGDFYGHKTMWSGVALHYEATYPPGLDGFFLLSAIVRTKNMPKFWKTFMEIS